MPIYFNTVRPNYFAMKHTFLLYYYCLHELNLFIRNHKCCFSAADTSCWPHTSSLVQCCSMEYDGNCRILWWRLVRYFDTEGLKCHYDSQNHAGLPFVYIVSFNLELENPLYTCGIFHMIFFCFLDKEKPMDKSHLLVLTN